MLVINDLLYLWYKIDVVSIFYKKGKMYLYAAVSKLAFACIKTKAEDNCKR